MKTPGVRNYYSALQEQFRLQSNILSDVLPHSGERGRNNEERFREFLSRVLPHRYSVGSGFVICSEASVSVSSQTDVVLFDEFYNAPIHRELASHVYPVEMVYGTVEVKRCIVKKDLDKICRDIAKLRALGEHRYYIKYGAIPKTPLEPDKLVVGASEFHCKVPPRAFVFAYEQKGWKSLSGLIDSLAESAKSHAAHIHGLAILESDWYVTQEAYAANPPSYSTFNKDALLNFVNGMLHTIGSVEMMPMSIDRYFK